MGKITQTLHQVAENLPLGLYRALVKRDYIVINYHMVSDRKLAHVMNLFEYKSVELFERDLIYLQNTFQLVSYDQLVDHERFGKNLPKLSVALTFDDGFAECFTVVRPLLLKYGIPCIFFVNTNYTNYREMANAQKVSLCVGKIKNSHEAFLTKCLDFVTKAVGFPVADKDQLIKLLKTEGVHNLTLVEEVGDILELDFNQYLLENTPYLTSEQIRTMNAEGFTIGSHGLEHVKFSSLDAGEIEHSMAESCAWLCERTGKNSVPFAFPHNADGVSRQLLEDILNRQTQIGLLFDTHGIRDEEKFLISRLTGDHFRKNEERKSGLSISIKKAYIEEIAERWSARNRVGSR